MQRSGQDCDSQNGVAPSLARRLAVPRAISRGVFSALAGVSWSRSRVLRRQLAIQIQMVPAHLSCQLVQTWLLVPTKLVGVGFGGAGT